MDGFRDRLNRGTQERGTYDRYERTSRRGMYSQGSQSGPSIDEIAQLVDESNGKQLEVINDLFEDAKDDRFESEKQILAAIDELIETVNREEAKEDDDSRYEVRNEDDGLYTELKASSEEILRTVNSNSDLLQQFAEEQLPMLIRGNSSILNQIREALSDQEDMIKKISDEIERTSENNVGVNTSNGNEEVLNVASTNNALLNALRSDVAGIQAEIRNTTDRLSKKADEENSPLDDEDVLTKSKAEDMYKKLDETIHNDCVKVYRNVQKLMEEQNAGADDSIKKSIGGLRLLSIINLILLLLNLLALLAKIFEII
ncbi:MAG: hypothetical protein SOX18_03860 [Lachnospiraceae bacterium]|jgi:hypothetical protein|nr:hypothetical protein [Lachnospiraceae bacterium]MDY3254557.1 hypothetical protein [Lachnospiraceae bacterium]MDY4836339.1 hypothetical protein [Lachnospiraceae bacterium]